MRYITKIIYIYILETKVTQVLNPGEYHILEWISRRVLRNLKSVKQIGFLKTILTGSHELHTVILSVEARDLLCQRLS